MKYLLLLLLAFVYSCKQESSKITNNPVANPSQASINNTSIVVDTNIVIVNSRAAVNYYPSNEKLELLKQEIGEEAFYTVADDYAYYTAESGIFLDSMKLKQIMITGNKTIRFLKKNNSKLDIKLDTVQSLMGTYLFDPLKDPVKADITDMKSSYTHYFRH